MIHWIDKQQPAFDKNICLSYYSILEYPSFSSFHFIIFHIFSLNFYVLYLSNKLKKTGKINDIMVIEQKQHPLDPLSFEEIRTVGSIVRKARQDEDTKYIFSSVALKEPPKKQVLAYLQDADSNGLDPPDREALVILIDRPSGLINEIIVSLTQRSITKWEKLQGVQPTQHPEEMLEAEKIMIKDEQVIEECRELGITDMSTVYVDPWAVGYYYADPKEPKQDKRRIMQGLMCVIIEIILFSLLSQHLRFWVLTIFFRLFF